MKREIETLKNYISEEKDRKIFAQVFDANAVMAIHVLATRGLFDLLEFVVSTGKEAHVFRATDVSGNYRAVKLYKIETSDFRNMQKYIVGDRRFKSIGSDKRRIVYAWVRKEYKNLVLASGAKARVPLPLGFKDNALVMEFIGSNGKAAPRLKDFKVESIEQLEGFYLQTIEFMARMFYGAGIVHADLSEYNALVNDNELVFIDLGQAVLRTHPSAREFFERDVKNVADFYSKKGLRKSFEEVYGAVKAKGKETKKKK